MNVPESTLKNMKIVRTFRPSSTIRDTDRLYVEFESESSVNILNRYKRNLPVHSKICLWSPPAIYPRYKALDDVSFQLRKVIQPYHQCDIRYESNDIALYKRLNRLQRWERVQVDDLPEVIIDPAIAVATPLVPASGRNRMNSTKRNRSNSTSSVEENQATKTLKLSVQEEDVVNVIDDELKNVSDEKLDESPKTPTEPTSTHDIGKFTEHHVYSPARQAPSKHSMITTTPGHLSSLKQTKISYKPTHLPVKKTQQDFQ